MFDFLKRFAIGLLSLFSLLAVHAQQPCNAIYSITGNTCIGSTLTIKPSTEIRSVEWMRDGTVILKERASSNNYEIVAGDGSLGNGPGQFYYPNRLYIANDGTMYIPDMGNNRVQKWVAGATAGITVAGGNGAGNAANQLNRPTCVVVDKAGNIYVSDSNNGRIQKWARGVTQGTTFAAGLNNPTALFLDKDENIYVSEQYGARVLKFPAGSATGVTVAGGNGTGSAANQLDGPTGLFVDDAGNLYICDTNNMRIQKWAPGASIGVTALKSSNSGFANPVSVWVKDGLIYTTDFTTKQLKVWQPNSSSGTTLAGSQGIYDPPVRASPVGIWIDSQNNIYFTDFENNRVIKLPKKFDGSFKATVAGTYSAKIVTAAGCELSTQNSITVTEKKVPVSTISATSNIVCELYPDPVFTVVPTFGGTTPTFQWRLNGVLQGSPSSQTTFSPKGLKKGDLIACDLYSTDDCITTSTVTSNIIEITDIPAPKPSIVINQNPGPACQGGNVTFTAIVEREGKTPVFQWYVNDKLVQGVSSNKFTSDEFKSGDLVWAMVTGNAEVCQETRVNTSEKVAVILNALLMPEVAISTPKTNINKGESVTFTALITNGGTNPSFQWQINGVDAAANGATFTTANLKDGDKVTCVLLSNEPCKTPDVVTSNEVEIHINGAIPVGSISVPNTYTPNADGFNDTWAINGLSTPANIKVNVYDRYGQAVFRSVGYAHAWAGENTNGGQCPNGVYYYVISLGDERVIAGSVTIIR